MTPAQESILDALRAWPKVTQDQSDALIQSGAVDVRSESVEVPWHCEMSDAGKLALALAKERDLLRLEVAMLKARAAEIKMWAGANQEERAELARNACETFRAFLVAGGKVEP